MSTVVNTKKIESIYDYDVTDNELLQLTDGYPESKEDYFYGLSQDSAYADLYRLFVLREDHNKAALFLSMIKDDRFKQQFITRPCCAVHS